MKISELGEFGLIERIRRGGKRRASRALVGIGDDAAAVLVAPGEALLTSTDLLLDGVHFDLKTTDLLSLGWKAAAVNLSDIAAMGGVPRYCLTALGIPASFSVQDIDLFYRGFRACLEKFGAELAGGDTCRSASGFTISVTVLGETMGGRAVTRAGAAPGDRIFVTGTLGDSAAGLALLRSRGGQARKQRQTSASARRLIERHVRPVPRVAWGMKLAAAGIVSAMIDVSDGLSSDLSHLLEADRIGAEVFAARIPLSRELRSQAPRLGAVLPDIALSGGEDYELLFTVPPQGAGRLRQLGVDAAEIGVITKEAGMVLVDAKGGRRPFMAAGYDHFRGKAGRTR